MNAMTFDTHAAVKTLREAGADEAMAEAIVNTASAAVGAGHDALATKADLAELRAATKADLAEHRAATQADLADLETRLRADLRAELGTIRWAVGLLAAFMFATGLRVFGII